MENEGSVIKHSDVKTAVRRHHMLLHKRKISTTNLVLGNPCGNVKIFFKYTNYGDLAQSGLPSLIRLDWIYVTVVLHCIAGRVISQGHSIII